MAYDGSLIFDTKLDAKGFKKGMDALSSTAGKSMKAVTNVMKSAVIGIGAVGIASAKVGADFEAGMSQVASTMGITVEEIRNGSQSFEMLEKAALNAGATTMFSATESAEALNYLALAGYSAEDSVSMLPKVLNLASAGGLDLAYASDLVTDSMSALGLNIDQADSFIDQMARTSQKSNTNVAQLGEAILTVGANARDLKGGTLELNTAIGLLGNVGLKGSEAGTKLRNVIRSLATPTDKAKEAFKQLKVDTYDANGELRGMDEVMSDLNKAMDGMTTQEKKEMMSQIFNPADMGAALTLLASTSQNVDDLGLALEAMGVPMDKVDISMEELVGNMGKFENESEFAKYAMEEFGFTAEESAIAYELLKAGLEDGTAWEKLEEDIRNSEGAAKDMSDTLNDNLKGDIELFKSALEGLGISIYKGFDEPLRGVVQTFTDYIGMIADTLGKNEELKQSMIEMGLTSDDLGYSIEEIPTGFLGMAQVIGEVFADIVVKFAEFAPTLIEMGVELIQALIEGIRESLPMIMEAVTEVITSFIEGWLILAPEIITLGIEVVTNLIQGIAEKTPDLIPLAVDMFNMIVDSFIENMPLILEAGMEIINSLVSGIVEKIPALTDKMVEIALMLPTFIIDNLSALIDAGLQIIQALVEGLINNIPKIIKTGLELIVALVEGLINNLPKLIVMGLELIQALADGILKNLPILIKAVPPLMKALIDGLMEKLPEIIKIGLEIIKSLVEGIINNIDTIVTTAIELIEIVSKALIDNLPLIIESGLELIMALVDGLINNIDLLVDSALKIVTALVEFIINNIDLVIDSALQLIMALVDGLLNNIELLVSAAMQLVIGIIEGLIKMLPQIISAGIDLVLGIVQGLLNALPQLISTGINLITELIGAIARLIPQFLTLGLQLLGELALGVIQALPTVVTAGKNVITSALEGMKAIAKGALDIGLNLVKGIWTGITNTKDWLLGKIKGFASSITSGIKGFFGIKSPSVLFKDEVGVMISKGLGEGIEEGTKYVTRPAEKMAVEVISQIKELNKNTKSEIDKHNKEIQTIQQRHNEDIMLMKKKAKDDERELTEKEIIKIRRMTEDSEKKILALEKKITKEKQEIAKANSEELLKISIEYIKEKKEQGELTLVDELAFWQEMTKIADENSEEYKQIIKNKQEVINQVNNKITKINEDYTKRMLDIEQNLIDETKRLNDEYTQAYEKRVKDLTNVAGLFSEFKRKEKQEGKTLIRNLKSQVSALEDYGETIASLDSRIKNADLMGELRELGPKNIGELQSLNAMSDEELKEFVKLYEKRFNLASNQATKELEPLKASVEREIRLLKNRSNYQLELLGIEWAKAMEEAVKGTERELSSLDEVGSNAIKGLQEGMLGMQPSIVKTAKDIVEEIIKTMKDVLEIKSPSQLIRDDIGKNIVRGIGVGFEDEMPKLDRDIKKSMKGFAEKLKTTVSLETKNNSKLAVAGSGGVRASNSVVNNDYGVKQELHITGSKATPSENARELKKAGRELALGY